MTIRASTHCDTKSLLLREAQRLLERSSFDRIRDRLELRVVLALDELEQHRLGARKKRACSIGTVQPDGAVDRGLRRDGVHTQVHAVPHLDQVERRLLHADVRLEPDEHDAPARRVRRLAQRPSRGEAVDGAPQPLGVLLGHDDRDLQALGRLGEALRACDDCAEVVNHRRKLLLHIAEEEDALVRAEAAQPRCHGGDGR
eukprot:CAMPEP_0182845240 /NCGR_PEP_ID=MMETSP0006_2-20121128/27219_1 /TAXON_ID=97485 /ORGANISM="Prymnesium parvum, Strain Texoma1" /LENGTH=199 /DNA_ID=CAMNT_0024975293 /DNA_START=193 /DNA_END=788 /DNA_ORIENTATION=-